MRTLFYHLRDASKFMYNLRDSECPSTGSPGVFRGRLSPFLDVKSAVALVAAFCTFPDVIYLLTRSSLAHGTPTSCPSDLGNQPGA